MRPREEKTAYPGIYKRVNAQGKVSGYRIRPRVKGSDGLTEGRQTFRRLTDARAEMERIRVAARDGRGGRRALRKTLAEAVDRYLEEELANLADSERRNRVRHLAWWKERRGRELLLDLDRAAVQQDLRSLDCSFATRNRYKAALSALLSAAVEEWGWLPTHPLRGGGRRRRPKGEREVERDREITAEEWTRLWPALKESRDKRLYPLVVLALCSGAREGELMGMERANLRLSPKELDPLTGVAVPAPPRCLVTNTKSGESRTLFFPGLGGEILQEMVREPVLSRYVLAKRGSAPDKVPTFPTGAWRYALKRAKIRDLRFHDLRHEWACMMLLLGVPEVELLIRGGWRSIAMVRRYAKQVRHRSEASFELIRILGLAPKRAERREA